MVTRLTAWALFASLMTPAIAAQAAVDVQLDRTTVPITDSIRVVFVADGEVDQPDFSPLSADFEILATAQSTSVNIVNNRMQQTASWTVDLMPRRVGELTLPAINFGNERSQPRTITVTAAESGRATPDGEVFLEIETEPADPYVQAQTHFTVRVFRAVAMSNASLTEPSISEGDAVIERLGNDISYETTRGGARFSVVERRYVIFPQRSGTIVIDPVVFEGRIGRRQSFFDSGGGRVVRVRSEAMELEVRPIPDSFPGQVWLPAERVVLQEDWPGRDKQWRAGEPLTRTLTLQARGLIASQLPEIGMDVPDGLKQYPDQPQLGTRTVDDAQIGSRRETIALIPVRAGEFTLPAIEIPWWNTQTDQLEYARLPEHTVRVLPAVQTATGGPSTPEPATSDSISADASGMQPGDSGGESAEIPTAVVNPWQWISAALALLWLLTVLGWWSSRRARVPVTTRAAKPDFNAAQLKRACTENDPAAATEMLLQWASTRWPGNASRSLGDLAARLDGPLQQELHRLSRVRYSQSNETWNGSALWQAFQANKQRRVPRSPAASPELEPLYRS